MEALLLGRSSVCGVTSGWEEEYVVEGEDGLGNKINNTPVHKFISKKNDHDEIKKRRRRRKAEYLRVVLP